MLLRSHAAVALLFGLFQFSSAGVAAQSLAPVCHPTVTGPVIVASHEQVIEAGERAVPPLIDTKGFGFAWPDTQMGVIKTAKGYEFFASDGAFHPEQMWQGSLVGNNNYGSVVITVGTLDNPLGTGDPQDVTISPNPDPGVNPNYPSYGYIGGGPVFQVPSGMTGAGNLIVVPLRWDWETSRAYWARPSTSTTSTWAWKVETGRGRKTRCGSPSPARKEFNISQ